jgi:hypothetical protein
LPEDSEDEVATAVARRHLLLTTPAADLGTAGKQGPGRQVHATRQ